MADTTIPAPVADGAVVLIEGSLTPAAGYLKRGQQVETTLTDTVKDLANKGFINYVNEVVQTPEPLPVDPSTEPQEPVAPSTPVGEATPIQVPDQTVPEVANPDVDNSLVDAGTAAKAATSRTTARK